jgi:hypothetical protein
VRADEIRERRRRSAELLERQAVAEVARADAATLLGEREAEEAQSGHLAHDVGGDLVTVLDLLLDRLEARLDEIAHGAGDLRELFRDVEIHHASPTWIAATPKVSRS